MNVRRTVATAAAALALVPLVGCSEDEPTEAAPSSEPTASATPTPSPSPTADPDAPMVSIGPGKSVPLPGEGAEPEDVIEQWLDGVVELRQQGSSERFTTLSSSTCSYCTSFPEEVNKIRADGGSARGGAITVDSVTTRTIDGRFTYVVKANAEPMQLKESADARPQEYAGGPVELLFRIRLTEDGWRVDYFAQRA